MELRTQLRVLNIISWCGFVLTVMVFCSPQWVILTTSVDHSKNPSENADTKPLHVTAFVQDIQNADYHHASIQNDDRTNTRQKPLAERNNPEEHHGSLKDADDTMTNMNYLTRQNSKIADSNGDGYIKTSDDKISNNTPSKLDDSRRIDVDKMKHADGKMGKQQHNTEKLSLDENKHADDRMGKDKHNAEKLSLKENKHADEQTQMTKVGKTKNADDRIVNRESFTSVTSTVTLHAGLWFFFTCVRNETDDILGKCYFSRYEDVQYNLKVLPAGMTWLRRFYEKIKATSAIGLLEFRCEACIGLVFSFVGCLAIVSYKKSLAKKKGCGIVACLSFFLSGGMIWTAVGKVATSIAQLQILYGKESFEPFYVPVPACLIVGAIGATFTLGTAISLVFVLSRDRNTAQDCDPVDSYYTKSFFPYHNLDQRREDE